MQRWQHTWQNRAVQLQAAFSQQPRHGSRWPQLREVGGSVQLFMDSSAGADFRPTRGHAVTALAVDDQEQHRSKRVAELSAKIEAETPQRIDREDEEYWRKVADNIDKPTARDLLSTLDLSYPLGYRSAQDIQGRKPQLYQYFNKIKKLHPRKVVIVKIGDFYEAIGLDAVLLVQFCSLNPMASRAAAGCPLRNIRRTVRDLVEEAGLSVVVCEETPADSQGTSKGQLKERFVAGVMTPAQPMYLHGLVDEKGDAAQVQETIPPILGVAASVNGYKIVEISLDLRKFVVTEGLTEDAVTARLHRGGLAPPLYVHRAETSRGSSQLTTATVENEWAMRISQLFRSQAGGISYYSSEDPVLGLVEIVKRDLAIDAGVKFREDLPDPRKRPKPLFHSTASNLGIHHTRGIPSLLDAVLPPSTPKMQRLYMRKLLLMPPPTEVAASIRRACSILSELKAPLPKWTLLNCSQVVRQINVCETNEESFRSLRAALVAAVDALQLPDLQPLAVEILPAVVLESGMNFSADRLLASCRAAAESINAVVEPTSRPLDSIWEGDEGLPAVLCRYITENEDFRGKVRSDLIREELEKVAEAGECVEKALKAAFALAHAHDLPKNAAKPVYDPINNSVWIKLTRLSEAAKKLSAAQKEGKIALIKPADRNGRVTKDVYSTQELEEAHNHYRYACDQARKAVRKQLKELAARLQGCIPDIVGAITFGVVASSLESHVREAVQRKWVLPQQATADSQAGDQGMVVEGMWPYWLDGRSPSTVRNSIDLRSMVILTGPNMAGKSTVMRSLCAVAVLSACGLYAPVSRAIVPFTDAFMLRTFSADSPLEGKSSFAIEMSEMKHVMQDVSSDSLVLVDELGKGTEPHAGTLIAASFIELLAAKKCRGIFATHLHHLLDMEGLKFEGVEFMCMDTVDAEQMDASLAGSSDGLGLAMDSFKDIAARMGGKVPTWTIVPGVCRHSLAFVVMAQQCGENNAVVKRAVELHDTWMAEQRQAGREVSPDRRLTPHVGSQREKTADRQPGIDSGSSQRVDPGEATQSDPGTAQPSGRRIEDAARVLAATAGRVFAELGGGGGQNLEGNVLNFEPESSLCMEVPGGCSGSLYQPSNGSGEPCVETQIVRAGQVPPPSTIGCSCVYVVMRDDGQFYVGETDDIKGRLATHRTKSSKVAGGPSMQAAYLVVPSDLQGKSAAKTVEASAIKSMDIAGFPLLSITDSRNKRQPRPRSQASPGVPAYALQADSSPL